YWFIEVAINWNAPLAWLSSWFDERGQAPAHAPIGVGDGPGSGGDGAGTATGGMGTGGASGGSSSSGTGSTGGIGSNGSDPPLSGTTALDANAPGGAANGATDSAGCGCRISS